MGLSTPCQTWCLPWTVFYLLHGLHVDTGPYSLPCSILPKHKLLPDQVPAQTPSRADRPTHVQLPKGPWYPQGPDHGSLRSTSHSLC